MTAATPTLEELSSAMVKLDSDTEPETFYVEPDFRNGWHTHTSERGKLVDIHVSVPASSSAYLHWKTRVSLVYRAGGIVFDVDLGTLGRPTVPMRRTGGTIVITYPFDDQR